MKRRFKIVVIDDEEDFCFFVRENLMRSGQFDVLIATTGKYGIRLVEKEKPDIVLLDLIMPDMPGEEVAEKLKSNTATSHIPILFVTALATEDDIECTSIGNHHFLAKPIRTKKLIETIQIIIPDISPTLL